MFFVKHEWGGCHLSHKLQTTIGIEIVYSVICFIYLFGGAMEHKHPSGAVAARAWAAARVLRSLVPPPPLPLRPPVSLPYLSAGNSDQFVKRPRLPVPFLFCDVRALFETRG